MQLESEAKPVGTTTYGGDNKDSTGKDGTFTIKKTLHQENIELYTSGEMVSIPLKITNLRFGQVIIKMRKMEIKYMV